MLIWMIIGGMVIILFLCMLCSSIQCKIIMHKASKHERIVVLLQACFGLLDWKYEWRSLKFINMEKGFHVQMNTKDNKGHTRQQETHINRHVIQKFIDNMKQIYHHTWGITVWYKRTLQQVRCPLFIWDTEIGLCDPALTCIGIGSTWLLKSVVMKWMMEQIGFEMNPKVEVLPNFQKPFFSTRVVCIINIRIIYAIYALFSLLIRILRTKGGIKVWRNILSKG